MALNRRTYAPRSGRQTDTLRAHYNHSSHLILLVLLQLCCLESCGCHYGLVGILQCKARAQLMVQGENG